MTCKTIVSGPVDDTVVSHGYCPPCGELAIAETDRWIKEAYWQPMDIAPLDAELLLWTDEDGLEIGRYLQAECGGFWVDRAINPIYPVAWRAKPAGPKRS